LSGNYSKAQQLGQKSHTDHGTPLIVKILQKVIGDKKYQSHLRYKTGRSLSHKKDVCS
jgi:hypothetical protein